MESTIVIGFSGQHRRAVLVWAIEESLRWQGRLIIVHCLADRTDTELPNPIIEEVEAAQTILDDAVAEARRFGARTSSKLCDGPPEKALVHMSRDAQLLVIGSTVRGPMSRVARASVTSYCVRHAVCPVVVLPQLA